MKPPVGVYVHIPFCRAKCAYCDFPSFPLEGLDVEAYFDALIAEIRSCDALKTVAIDTVFMGGGTPTVVPSFLLARVLGELGKYSIAADAEITVEANPGTLSAETLKTLKDSGVNRLSIGLQVWQDKLLSVLGRIHTKDEFSRQYSAAADVGFTNINVDVMFGLPGQSLADWAETLQNVTALAPAHISAYSLILEPGTPFWELNEHGGLALPSEDADREMYERGVEFLEDAGYRRYEISNFAKPGFECRHNLKYWRREQTLGFGLGAHSFFGGARWHNPYDLGGYICAAQSGLKPVETPVPRDEAMEEAVFLGLRMSEGINFGKFRREFGVGFMGAYEKKAMVMTSLGLLHVENDRAALTGKGFSLSERVIYELLV